MRRLSILLLLLMLLLTGCATRFSISADGYLDAETGRVYKPLSSAFEAVAGGEELGTWENEAGDVTLSFREIASADAARFLMDDSGVVYCADESAPNVSDWRVERILVCDESVVSVAVADITDANMIAQIRAQWQESEQAELPYTAPAESRRLKMVSEDCPGIYYCVLYMIYDDGTAYFYDRDSGRAVQVGKVLAQRIPIT